MLVFANFGEGFLPPMTCLQVGQLVSAGIMSIVSPAQAARLENRRIPERTRVWLADEESSKCRKGGGVAYQASIIIIASCEKPPAVGWDGTAGRADDAERERDSKGNDLTGCIGGQKPISPCSRA